MNSATESAPETAPAKSRFTSELSQVVRRNVQTYTILLALVGIWLIFFFLILLLPSRIVEQQM